MDMIEVAMNKAEQRDNTTTPSTASPTKTVVEFDRGQIGIDGADIRRMEEPRSLSIVQLEERKIIHQASAQNGLVHKFRDIRTALLKKQRGNIVLVTSFIPQAGTSFFARNLASVIAFESTRTALLVDCNTERPNVGKTFDLHEQVGLTDYLERDDVQIEDIIHPVGVKRLRCLPLGKLHTLSSEHFTHPKFRSCLLKLKERYHDRHIILDGPPLLSSSDAGVLLDVCDQVIVVLPFGKVDQAMLTTLSKLVDKEKLAGVVYNEYVE